MLVAPRCVRILALAVLALITGCSDVPSEDEALASVAQATTQTCESAPLAGECRYAPVAAFASSVEGGSTHPASDAIDGNCSTRWSSAFSDPQWLKVDLGSRRPLSRVVIHWEAAASKDYKLQVSDNATDWTTIANDENATIVGSGNSRVDTLSGLTASARYVRVYSLARLTQYGNSIFELEVFGTDCGGSPECSQIPVFPLSAAASSSENSQKGPEKAIDGLASTRWSSTFSDNQWLRLDLGSTQSFTRIVLDWEAATSSKYEIQVSNSSSGPWTVVRTIEDSKVGPRTDDIKGLDVTTRYVRIFSRRRTTNYGVSLFEVRLFRESCDECEQILVPTGAQASSKESDAFPASKAVDGDYGTRWSSQFSDPQWLRLDFGQDRRINGLIVKWEGAASKSYRIETAASSAGPWQVVTERTNQGPGPRVDILGDLAATARFLRIFSTARTTSFGISIFEVIALGNQNALACGGCLLGDTDGDGAFDCVDACSRDPQKTAPGACGCNLPETDSDLDGNPDCSEVCNADGKNFSVGQCGCLGLEGLAPAGTPCTDGPCGEGVCDGSGSCGNRNCPPQTGCVLRPHGSSWYWFCPAATWQQAADRCQALSGRRLVRIEDQPENDFVARNVTAASWTGANDRATEGTWRWRTVTGSDGDAFWQGNGPVDFRFNSWAGGSPAGPDCATLATGAGTWEARDCGESRPYVCEKNARPIAPFDPPPLDWCKFFPPEICNDLNDPDQVPTESPDCVEQSSVLPDTFAEFEDQVNACLECDTAGEDCSLFCTEAATPPTGTSPCADWEKESHHACALTDVDTSFVCAADADCDAGFICRLHYACQRCDEFGNCSEEFCPGTMRCGRPIGTCAPAFGTEPCGDIEICTTPDVVGDSDPENNPATDLTEEPVTPDLFQGDAPQAPPEEYPADDPPCSASPCGVELGQGHPWCVLGTDGTVPERNVADGKQGQSGSDGDIIQFDFDPNMDLTYKTTPMPFGVSRYDLTASASFSAKARFAFLGLRPEIEIVDAAAKVVANICNFTTDGTKLEVFGHDFLPEILGRSPVFNSNEVLDAQACQDALDDLGVLMNRAKKAMRDAQDLIRQYKTLRDLGQAFSPGFCQAVAGDPEAGFPPGDCNSETPEQTIERFRQHYVNQVNKLQGELEGLQNKVLSSATLPPELRGISIGGPGSEESQLIINVPFAIGPIPMKLEVEAFLSYGIEGSINFEFAPTGLFLTGQQNVARVTANAIPGANAAIRVFVGAGFGVNGFDASIGVEGSVTLGDVSVPLWAGAGLDVAAEDDERDLLTNDDGTSTGVLFPPGGAKQYRFFLHYDYGGMVSVRDILKGELFGRVRIKFFFFSKTWRKAIASFPGLGAKDFKLFEGEGGASIGSVPWALVRMETPFLSLALPTTPPGVRAPGLPATVPFDPARVEELFFDNLCQCREFNEDCTRDADCCEDVPNCFSDPGQTGRTVCSGCRSLGLTCRDNQDCCDTAPNCIVEPGGDGVGRCSPCKNTGQSCTEDRDCCSGGCVDNVCADCLPFGEGCQGRVADCCTKDQFTSELLSCVTLTTNPEFTCWCQATGGLCPNADSDFLCCDSEATCKLNLQGQFVCTGPPVP